MGRFDSAEATVTAFIDSKGVPAEELLRLVHLHHGQYDPSKGLAGLRGETQRLWVPRHDGRIIKVPEMDVPSLDSQYTDAVREESWDLLDALGCTDGFIPLSEQYGVMLAHGTIPPYAHANFDWIIELAKHGLRIEDEIFMLSAPYMRRDPVVPGLDSLNAKLIPERLWTCPPPITEAVSMAWLWEHMAKPPSLESLQVTVISSCDAITPDGSPIIPDTLDSLEAMYQCRFDAGVMSKPVLNVAATRRQLLRQHVVTRAFLRRKGIDCQIHTVNAHTNEPQWLVLALREVAALVWSLCDEFGVPADCSH